MSQKIKFKRSASGKNNQSQSGITWKMDEEDEEDDSEPFLSMAPITIRGPFGVFDQMREHLSKDRLRYKMNGFNLDLRYITPNIIVMATPADRGTVALNTRNHIDEVQRFLRTQHDGKTMVFNLVGETDGFVFDSNKLGGVNHEFAFLDRQITSLAKIQNFCSIVKTWLEQSAGNVAVIMCRSGRNRCALMVCSYLLFAWPEEFPTAKDVMDYFTWRRMRIGEAVRVPSQRRYIGYFSQRFAAEPQDLFISRIVVPVGPLKMDKLRLNIDELRVGDRRYGNSFDLSPVWTSKGKQMGKIEEGESYILFDFPEALKITGDTKISSSAVNFSIEGMGFSVQLKILGRKYTNGPFLTIFSFWFNTGFIDHTPVVWDLACFDEVTPAWRGVLPEDFHIQTLFLDKPRVACTISKTKAARIYCWDCEDPFLSLEESITVHKPRLIVGPDGEEEEIKSGPAHRYHPIVEEDCYLCKQRQKKGDSKEDELELPPALRETKAEKKVNMARNTMEYSQRKHGQAIKREDVYNPNAQGTVYSVEEGLRFLQSQRKTMAKEKRDEIMYYGGWKQDQLAKPPVFGLPTVYCVNTKQFLCSWCNRHGLSDEARKAYTRFSLPLVLSSTLRYSGCARQTC